jgi:hypothetical protein
MVYEWYLYKYVYTHTLSLSLSLSLCLSLSLSLSLSCIHMCVCARALKYVLSFAPARALLRLRTTQRHVRGWKNTKSKFES